MQKIKLHHLFTPHISINSKLIKELNVRLKTIKIVEENIGSKILDIAGSNIFSGYIFIYPRQMKQKKKINRTTSN